MKGIKLWLFVLLGLLSVQLYTVLFPVSSASAASIYDDNYKKTRDLVVKEDNCSPINITSSWVAAIQNSSRFAPNPYNSLISAISGDGRWGVSQELGMANGILTGEKSVIVFWTEDDSLSLVWDLSPGHLLATGNNIHLAVIRSVTQQGNPTCDSLNVQYYSTNEGYVTVSNTSGIVKNLFVYTDHPNYPVDYEGSPIPSTYVPVSHLSYSINFKINGSFKDFSAQYTNKTTDPVSTLPDPTLIRWLLVDKSKIDINGTTVNSRYSPLCDVYLKRSQPFTTQSCGNEVVNNLDMSKDYMITAQGILNGDQEQGYLIKYLFVSFDIDFNNPQYGLDTGNCSLSEGATDDFNGKACAGDSRYQDCTQFYGDITKLGDVIGCYFNNIQVWFQDILMFLFVPSPKYLLETYTDMNEFMHQKLGLLLYPFDWIFLLFNSFLNAANSCAGPNLSAVPNVSPGGTFFGSSVNLNVCSAEQNFPQIYNVAVFFIRVVAVLGMVLACYRKLLITLNNHEDKGGSDGRGGAIWG